MFQHLTGAMTFVVGFLLPSLGLYQVDEHDQSRGLVMKALQHEPDSNMDCPPHELLHGFGGRTSTSNSSITFSTTPKLSINPFTATRNMRFVVALYDTSSTVFVSSPHFAKSSLEYSPARPVRENERCTSGESSASTWRAWRAVEARRCVGKGRERMSEQGKLRSRGGVECDMI
jgi:hypothetical protein